MFGTPPRRALRVGTPAPDFELLDQHGHPVKLSEFRGRPVVLFFYPKDGTPGCTREVCAFRDQYEVFLEAGAVVLGISSDPPHTHRRFAARHRLPYRLLSDPKGAVRRAYGVPRTLGLIPGRVTFVIDREGFVRHVFNAQFNPEAHVEEALRVLRRL